MDNVHTMTLKVESATPDLALSEAIAHTVQEVIKLRGTVEMLAPDTLPNDGKVIEDARSYE